MEEEHGGYDFNIAGEDVMKELECAICKLLMREVTDLPCTHAFCKACLNNWQNELKKKNEEPFCPICREVYNIEKVQQGKRFDRMITTSMKVKCKQNNDGCKWCGTISEYENHEKICDFKLVECPFHCNINIIRKHLEDHKKTCLNRLVDCEFCQLELGVHQVKEHLKICELYLVTCSNKDCQITMQRREVQDHIQHRCEFQLMSCPYKEMGCDVTVIQKEIEKHIEQSTQHHLLLLSKHTINLSVALFSTQQELKDTKNTLQCTKERLEVAENQLKEFSDREDDLQENLKYINDVSEALTRQVIVQSAFNGLHTFEKCRLFLEDKEYKEYFINDRFLDENFKKSWEDRSGDCLTTIAQITSNTITEKKKSLKKYNSRFRNLLLKMEENTLYWVEDNSVVYLKMNLNNHYIKNKNKIIFETICKEESTALKSSNKKYIYSNEAITIKQLFFGGINVCIHIDKWNTNTSNLFVHTIHKPAEFKAELTIFSEWKIENLMKYSCDGEILLRIEKATVK